MQELQFTARGLARRERGRCPELQLYAVFAALLFGAITVVKTIAGPLIARPDQAKTTEDIPIVVDVLKNDEHPIGEPFSLVEFDGQKCQDCAEIEGNRIVYDPAGAFDYLAEGKIVTEKLAYSIEDDADGSAHALLTITIQGVNDPPKAQDDKATTDKNKSIIVDVLANDEDPEGDKLTLLENDDDGGLHPRAEIKQGSIVYDPGGAFDHLTEGMTDREELTYFVADHHGAWDSAKLTITIQGKNLRPMARGDEAATGEDEIVIVDVVANDADPVGRGLRLFRLDRQWLRGSAEIEGNRIVYDPGDVFNYLVERREVLASYVVGAGCPVLKQEGLPSSDPTNPYASAAPPKDVVKTLQKALLDLTFEPGPIDGIIGPRTSHAIREWQKTQKMDATGNLTSELYRCLLEQRRYLNASTIEKEILIYFVEDNLGARASAQLTITIEGRNNKDPPVTTTTIPPDHLHPNCGLAPADQRRGVPFCARESDERNGPPPAKGGGLHGGKKKKELDHHRHGKKDRHHRGSSKDRRKRHQ